MSEADFGELLSRALRGDQAAWNSLVAGLSAVILGVARGYRLGEADALDLCQSTWLQLAQRISAVREPSRLPGWLATTARRLAIGTLAGRRHEVIETCENREYENAVSPELVVLRAERELAFRRAVRQLPDRQRWLILLLLREPRLSYPEIAAELGIEPGSVGPLRSRSFETIRRRLLADGFEYR
ncbi:RNA polymerase sigma factor [Amycolatopsis nigrescens]|uniref:RNA polymerase sigma factor n=1 Tax=Amycolatopsis nigrescens TaxID=381445 RepID=UPI00036208F6|nr:sigma-70 family RNA polymerase sigma factor [Amycolatopsis nigrescens]